MPREVLALEALPFVLGPQASPHNPPPFPDTLPFTLDIDTDLCLLGQRPSPELAQLLTVAYDAGSQIGTPMDDTAFGRSAALDFCGFVDRVAGGVAGKRVLEIGPGRGYLLRLLGEAGARATGIEPGVANRGDWERHGVDVVRGTFPTTTLDEPADLIVAYAVLEHIQEPSNFLHSVAGQLAPGAMAIFAVPDCEPYLADGDASILVHEHHWYFTKHSLARTLARHGLATTTLESAGSGGLIYAAVEADPGIDVGAPRPDELELATAFGQEVSGFRGRIARRLRELDQANEQLGIFVASRALALLPTDHQQQRFFDDDPEIRGQFYPPFGSPIESRDDLVADPPDELWIMSRTFGPSIAEGLGAEKSLANTRIVTVDQIDR